MPIYLYNIQQAYQAVFWYHTFASGDILIALYGEPKIRQYIDSQFTLSIYKIKKRCGLKIFEKKQRNCTNGYKLQK